MSTPKIVKCPMCWSPYGTRLTRGQPAKTCDDVVCKREFRNIRRRNRSRYDRAKAHLAKAYDELSSEADPLLRGKTRGVRTSLNTARNALGKLDTEPTEEQCAAARPTVWQARGLLPES